MAKGKVITIAVSAPKPRNPLHSALAAQSGGAHRKPHKSLRAKANAELKSIKRTDEKFGPFFSPAWPGGAAPLQSRAA